MHLRTKVFLVVGGVLLTLLFVVYYILSAILLREFQGLEQADTKKNVQRVSDAIQNKIDDLSIKVGDWGQWDDTYTYIQNQNQEFIDTNLQDVALQVLGIDFTVITDESGKILFKKQIDSEGKSTAFSPAFDEYLRTHPSLMQHTNSQSVHKGLVTLPEGVVVTVARAVTSSDGLAPVRGTIIFAFFVDSEFQQKMADLTHLKVGLYPYVQANQNEHFAEAAKFLHAPGDVFVGVSQKGDEIVSGHTVIFDFEGHPSLFVDVAIPRDIYKQGQESVRLFSKIMLGSSIFIILSILFLFEVLVLRKIFRLKSDIGVVREHPEKHALVTLPKTHDEFESLAQEMNASFTKLYTIESRLEDQRNELKKFQLAAEKSFNHLIITDADGVIMYANPAASKNTGYNNQEIIGQKPSLWGKQMPRAVYTKMWKTIKEEKQPYTGELTNKRKDGTLYLVDVNITPLLDDAGKVRYFVGLERDITEERARQKQDKEHLLQLEEFNDRLAAEKARAEGILRYLRSIGEGVFATDRHGNVVFVNDKAADMIGKSPTEILGEESFNVFEFHRGALKSDKRLHVSEIALKLKKAQSFPREIFLFRSRKDPVPVAGSYGPIYEQNHLAGAIVVFQDISERYEFERVKTNFLSIAAHQLRTPLGSMRWSMELLLNGDLGKLPKKAKETVEQLYENTKRMVVLVGDLLSVARIDQGENVEKKKLADVGLIWDEVIKTMKPQAEKLGITLTLNKQKTAFPSVMLPPKHLYEAFENLVSNALKYNREHGTVVITLKEESDGIAITIQDTGIGIPKESQSKIFSKFFRAQNAIHKETEGSGLGLSVVKSYLEEAGANIYFESEENVGTTFFIKLPFHPVHS